MRYRPANENWLIFRWRSSERYVEDAVINFDAFEFRISTILLNFEKSSFGLFFGIGVKSLRQSLRTLYYTNILSVLYEKKKKLYRWKILNFRWIDSNFFVELIVRLLEYVFFCREKSVYVCNVFYIMIYVWKNEFCSVQNIYLIKIFFIY